MAKIKGIGKTLNINIDLSKLYKAQVAEFWKKQPDTMDLDQAIKAAMIDARKHFKKEKQPWPLSAGHYAEEIATNFIGISPYKLAAAALADVADLVIHDGKIEFVSKPKKRKPAKKKARK